jgi:hypothetical protein
VSVKLAAGVALVPAVVVAVAVAAAAADRVGSAAAAAVVVRAAAAAAAAVGVAAVAAVATSTAIAVAVAAGASGSDAKQQNARSAFPAGEREYRVFALFPFRRCPLLRREEHELSALASNGGESTSRRRVLPRCDQPGAALSREPGAERLR